ncbi:type III secretion system export apparatus subunit SctT [Dyella flagellata]|uniref:EscT/YscT/HrcT family type III secretion system export apparatus protein n=1 Tax=Dyella flagellata TaxID=1867833 RepID=A0ABQ5X874_9GAMM|nr:type III secretion system export apparatus subunit SctT [Dyella flagellata]GLQ87850.1 EscT/YscT/HrcT family type III secretion system export apparatus protein [Dyella flagellata]
MAPFSVDDLGNQLDGIALTLPRIVAAFLVLPLMTSETMPALVRNSFYVSLAILVYPLAAAAHPSTTIMQGATWVMVLGKEVFVGLLIGFCFGTVFWALGAAGSVIDTKAGTSMSMEMDPLAGQQSTITGVFLMQVATWLFMVSGAFMVFLDLLMSSYAIWPVASLLPPLRPGGMEFFVGQFNYLMTAVLVFSAPMLVVMSLVDIAMGLVNRYAQQLNVFSLAMPIKSWLSTWVLLLALGAMIEVVMRKLYENRDLLVALKRIL